MTTDDKQEKILDLVRKLLAQAEGTSFKEESNSFYAKAQELMAKYAIDQAMLKPEERARIVERMVSMPGKQVMAKAKRSLLNTVAHNNRCRAFIYGGTVNSQMGIIGFAADAKFVELLYTSLLTQLTSECERQLREAGTARNASVFRNNFAWGFAQEVANRMYRQRVEEAAAMAVNHSQALAIYTGEVDDWIRQNMVLRKARGSKGRERKYDSTARGRGMAAGAAADMTGGRKGVTA